MTTEHQDNHDSIRAEVRKLCARYPAEYWRKLDETRSYPTAFVRALTEAGYLSVLIPEEFGGSGLGLAIAREIVQAHGGKIDLESTPQTGTRFTVSIPALEASPSAPLISAEPARPAEVAVARR